jgi:hypothetical protein
MRKEDGYARHPRLGPGGRPSRGNVLPDDYLTTADEMLSHAHRTQSVSDKTGALGGTRTPTF